MHELESSFRILPRGISIQFVSKPTYTQEDVIHTLTEARADDHCPRAIGRKSSGLRRPIKKRFIFPVSFFNVPADLGGMLG